MRRNQGAKGRATSYIPRSMASKARRLASCSTSSASCQSWSQRIARRSEIRRVARGNVAPSASCQPKALYSSVAAFACSPPSKVVFSAVVNLRGELLRVPYALCRQCFDQRINRFLRLHTMPALAALLPRQQVLATHTPGNVFVHCFPANSACGWPAHPSRRPARSPRRLSWTYGSR